MGWVGAVWKGKTGSIRDSSLQGSVEIKNIGKSVTIAIGRHSNCVGYYLKSILSKEG